MTAIVSMPLALMAAAFCTKPGRWFLWQVGVKAPGTANSTTFLPLKISSVVFGFGPSAVMTRNVALGRRSPTLMGMARILSVSWFGRPFRRRAAAQWRGKIGGGRGISRAGRWSRSPLRPATAVNFSCAPSGLAPGGSPSSAKTKRCRPAGAPSTFSGNGNAQFGVGTFRKQSDLAAGRGDIDQHPRRLRSVVALDALTDKSSGRAGRRDQRHAPLGGGDRCIVRAALALIASSAFGFRRDADFLADRVIERQPQHHRLRGIGGSR